MAAISLSRRFSVPDNYRLFASAGQGGENKWYNYDPSMPPTFRCDAAEGTTWGGGPTFERHGPFGLSHRDALWYRFPDGKGLAIAHVGSLGWLSGWPAKAEGRPNKDYDVPADGSLPPPVGAPPTEGTVCFGGYDSHSGSYPCVDTVTVRAVSCGAFALWELPPSPNCPQGYCLAW
eukprot:SAG11_NODE_4_length_33019_cov_28.098909_24_plen_176_part_00